MGKQYTYQVHWKSFGSSDDLMEKFNAKEEALKYIYFLSTNAHSHNRTNIEFWVIDNKKAVQKFEFDGKTFTWNANKNAELCDEILFPRLNRDYTALVAKIKAQRQDAMDAHMDELHNDD